MISTKARMISGSTFVARRAPCHLFCPAVAEEWLGGFGRSLARSAVQGTLRTLAGSRFATIRAVGMDARRLVSVIVITTAATSDPSIGCRALLTEPAVVDRYDSLFRTV